MSTEPPTVSIVICTYNRLALLQQAVASSLADATRQDVPFEIVIADNSPSRHAEAFAAALAADGRPVRWVHASPPNISVARNAGLHAARAGLVAFLDDDLVVEPGWLDHLLAALRTHDADVAVGGVRPRFESGSAPAWDSQGARFTRTLDLPSGALIRAGRGKPRGFAISTASSIWRRSTCFTDTEPFDPQFGASGGEDLELFLRLERRGCRFAWSAEAKVWETIPTSRTALRYQVMRAYSGGQVFVAATVRHRPRPLRAAAGLMARGAVQTVLNMAVLLPTLVGSHGTGRERPVRHVLDAASALGKMTWWRKIPLYHVEKPSAVRPGSA